MEHKKTAGELLVFFQKIISGETLETSGILIKVTNFNNHCSALSPAKSTAAYQVTGVVSRVMTG